MKLKIINLFVYFSAIIGNLLAFSAGIAFSWTSPMLPKLSNANLQQNPLGREPTVFELSWIAGLTSLGAIFGPIIATPITDKLGRKKALLFVCCPFVVALLMLAFSKTIVLFFIGRFIMGLGAGSVFTVLPTYLVEIAEDHNRGVLSCIMSVFVSSGIAFTYSVGPVLSVQNFCLVSLTPLVFFIPLCLIFAPETPQFLASINDQQNLKKSLVNLRRNKNLQEIENEISEITKTVEELRKNKSGIRDLFKVQVLRRGMIISLGLIILQQLAGIIAVISYMQSIFEGADTGLSPEISVVIVGVVQVFTTVVTSSLVDILGRKILFLVSSVFSCVALFSLGLYFFLKNHHFDVGNISWLPVTSLIVFIIAFNIGLGPLPWTVMAEMFPSTVKATASTLTAVACMSANFVIMLCFPSLATFLGMDMTFWCFSVMCISGAVGIWCFLPETKGKSLKEIHHLLGGSK